MLHAGVLSGFVYVDADGDGTRDAAELGVPGVVISLTGSGSLSRSTMTGDSGFYSFDELEEDTYQISKRQSPAMIDGQDATSIPGAVSAENMFSNLVLADDQSLAGIDFGERGLKPEFVNITLFFSSAPPPPQMLRELMALSEELGGDADLAASIRAGGNDAPPATNRLPIAADDLFSVAQNAVLTITPASGLLANDVDPDGDALTATLVDQGANGAATLASDGSFTYTPNTDFSGTDSFTYQASDSVATSNLATVTINVNADTNQNPVAADDAYVGTLNEVLTVTAASGVLANDVDPDGDALTATVVDQGANGSATLASDGSFTYTPNTDFSGTDSFTYQASDSVATSNLATVTINVNADTNQNPVAADDAYVGTLNEVLTVTAASGVLANDVDPDGDALTATVVDQGANGSATLASDGSFTYTPNTDFSGIDSFTYTASDSVATSNVATVTITVNPAGTGANQAPVATDDVYAVQPGGVLMTTPASGVLANDTDADGDSLSTTLVGQASSGVAVLSGDGSFTYTPNAGFAGADMFTYQVSDGTVASNVATVSIAVRDTGNMPFGPVTVGSFDDPDLQGTRTDMEEGAPPITAEHVTTAVDYQGYSNPPTYGPHHGFQLDASNNSITPRPTGVYSTEQPDEDLVHNLEHGHVWISYNPSLVSGSFLNTLTQLVEDGGSDTGVILTPRSGNDSAIAVASWGHLLTINDDLIRASERFVTSNIRTFIEMNRGHAPEGFIPSGQKTAASESLDDGLPHSV